MGWTQAETEKTLLRSDENASETALAERQDVDRENCKKMTLNKRSELSLDKN